MRGGLVCAALSIGGVRSLAAFGLGLLARPGGGIDFYPVRANLVEDLNGFGGIAKRAEFVAMSCGKGNALADSRLRGHKKISTRCS
jgi:hypothetical protein